MGRSPCCAKEGLNRGAWTAQEDKLLTDYIKLHGEGKWGNLPKRAGLKRCGKSCRLRWLNYLRPDIKRGNISPDEEDLIIRLHRLLGNRWSLIAGRLPGRTDNEIKNYWNTNLGKKLLKEHNKTLIQNKLAFPSPSSPPKMASHLFLTKAFDCSKVVAYPHLQLHEIKRDTYKSSVKTRPPPASSVMVGEAHVPCNPDKEAPSVAGGENNNNNDNGDSKDFFMEFAMGNGADADGFTNFESCEFNYCNKSNGGEFSTPSPPGLLISEEMLQDLTMRTTDFFQPRELSCLSPFTSFLDSGGVWPD